MGLLTQAIVEPQREFQTWFHTPGESTPDIRSGDLILTHGSHFFSKLIRFGQRLRYRGAHRPHAYWNHAAVAVDDSKIIEALGPGVQKNSIENYTESEYVVVRVASSTESRSQMVNYLEWVCEIGTSYSWGVIALITLELLTGGYLRVNLDGSEICSTLAAESLKCDGIYFARAKIMPADLAYVFAVKMPTG